MGSADGRRGAGSQRRDGTVMPLPPPPSSRPGQGLALARPPGASPRKKHSHGPSADFMEAWSRAVVRTLPAPPGVRPGRPAVAPPPARRGPPPTRLPRPRPGRERQRTRRGTDRRRAAKLSRREPDEVVVIDDDDEDDRGQSNGGTSTSEPSDPRRRSPRKSNTNTSAMVTVDLTDSAPEPAAKTPAASAAPPAPALRRKENKTIIENVARRAKLSRPPHPFVSSHRSHSTAEEVPFARDAGRPKDTPRVKDDEEITREIYALLDRRKLRLVLDLDHTLLNSATFEDCAADGAGALLESRVAAEIQAESARKHGNTENPASSSSAETHRSLHRLADSGLWTKTRPGVRTFLRKAAAMFEIHICTAGSQAYAERMRALLDPTRELVRGSVVGLATFDKFGVPEPGEVVKTMERELRGSEPVAVVLDDTAAVWPGHAENLIVCERYVYFPSCARKFGNVTPSLLERRVDESAERGMLATVFDVLQRVHAEFFARRAAARELRLRVEASLARDGARAADDDDDDTTTTPRLALHYERAAQKTKSVVVPVTVPELLTREKRRVLRGSELVFSGVVPSGADPSAHPLWRLAEAFGARCVRAPDDAATTHVVVEPANLGPGGTDKMIWATRLGKHVVTPGWVLTSAASFQRADETAFAVRR